MARKPSVELIEALDFDFINAMRSDDEGDILAPDATEWTNLQGLSRDEREEQAEAVLASSSQDERHVRRSSTIDLLDILGPGVHSRRSSLDAFMFQDMAFDEGVPDIPEIVAGDISHADSSALFNDIFHQFAQENGGSSRQGESVDLSAYAHHAAALQRDNKTVLHVSCDKLCCKCLLLNLFETDIEVAK